METVATSVSVGREVTVTVDVTTLRPCKATYTRSSVSTSSLGAVSSPSSSMNSPAGSVKFSSIVYYYVLLLIPSCLFRTSFNVSSIASFMHLIVLIPSRVSSRKQIWGGGGGGGGGKLPAKLIVA